MSDALGASTRRRSDLRLVVVGDVLLDVDVETEAHRLSPDGPAPVLEQRRRDERAGGAALAASLAADQYDGEVVLVAPLSDDAAAARVRELLDPRVRLVPVTASGRTPVKTRLRSGGVTVARLDDGDKVLLLHDPSGDVLDELASAGALLVSDYGGGTTTAPALRTAVESAARRVPVVWDPHPRGGDPVARCALVTPNAGEAGAGGPIAVARARAADLARQWSASAVAVTLGARGALLADVSGRCTVFPVPLHTDGDPCGAGDCFAATAAVALLTGAVPSEAVGRAVARASAFVAGGGVAARARRADGTADDDDNDAPRSAPDVIARVRAAGGTVVATGGCFDLLHPGHVDTLEAARGLGDCLVVCLNSDASVRRLKGDGRPLQSAEDRARVLRALRAVDAVIVFDEDTPHAVLDRLRPDVWVKGDDYRAAELPEAALVRGWGGEVVTVPYLSGRSTSGLVELSRR